MIKLLAFSFIVLVVPSYEQQQKTDTPRSPCPNVFLYEPPGSEPGRWYGVVNLSTDNTLHSLWLNIVLDKKADILGNWVGDVSTTDNIDFKIENTKMKIEPGPALAVRFFVQYNSLNPAPKLRVIRLNGREICNSDIPQVTVFRPDEEIQTASPPTSRTQKPKPTRPAERPVQRPADRPSERPIDRPVERPIDRPVERPIDRPADRPLEQPVERPRPEIVVTRPETRPWKPNTGIRTEDQVTTRPVQGRPVQEGPVYVPPVDEALPSKIDVGPTRNGINNQPTPGFVLTPSPPFRTTPPSSRNDPDDFDETRRPDPSEYFGGGQPTLVIGSNTGSTTGNQNNFNNPQSVSSTVQCGTVIRQNPNPLILSGKPTREGEWPWQIALYRTQIVDNTYICGGTLVSHKHVITAAHCIALKSGNRIVNKDTLTVYLGKHNLRTSTRGVQIRFVEDIIKHPLYNATTYTQDLAILVLREPVTYSDWVRPVCLWPENLVDLNNVIDKKGSVVGWGYDETGLATEELTLVEMPVVSELTCLKSYNQFFHQYITEYTYCAGYRNGSTVCNGDSGGGMVFNINNVWYLRGLVSLSVARHNESRCDPKHFIVFTDLAKFLPWLKRYINDY